MNEEEISSLRRAGAISREAREYGASLVKEGAKLYDVAEEVEGLILKRGAKPAFPINIGINDVAAHFTPATDDEIRFEKGQIVKIDVGAHVNGYVGDTTVTVEVGTRNWTPLIESSREALRVAIQMLSDGVQVSAIGGAVERTIKAAGFKPITNLTGHGLKRYVLHAEPTIPNLDDGGTARLRTDTAIAIEPFATNGFGQTCNDRPGNIYRVLREKPMRDPKSFELFHAIKKEFNTLPFCERWCTRLNPEAPALLKTLVRHGLISRYAVLKEVRGGMVSQAEHTIALLPTGPEITT